MFFIDLNQTILIDLRKSDKGAWVQHGAQACEGGTTQVLHMNYSPHLNHHKIRDVKLILTFSFNKGTM